VDLRPSGVAGGLWEADFLPATFLTFFCPPAIMVSTAAAPLPAALALDLMVEAFLPLGLTTRTPEEGSAFLDFPPRVTTLVFPSLNYHSPQELARMPWLTWPLPPVMGAISTFLEAAAAQT